MIKNYFVMGIVATGLVASWTGCSSSSGSGTGAGTTTSTGTKATSSASTGTATTGSGGATTGTASTSSTTGTTSSGAGGAGGGSVGTGGASNAGFTCTGIPSPAPSKGSCVTFTGVDGGEADGGLDSMGNGTSTNCDPVTNAGCTGTDVCSFDTSMKYYDCFSTSGATVVPVCGDCSGSTATCGAGTICVGISDNEAYCVQVCCTDADCGTGSKCDTAGLTTPLPSGVGICD